MGNKQNNRESYFLIIHFYSKQANERESVTPVASKITGIDTAFVLLHSDNEPSGGAIVRRPAPTTNPFIPTFEVHRKEPKG